MRVLMLSKACVVGLYQQKLERIAEAEDVELVVAAPASWRDGTHVTYLERAHTSGYELVVEPLALNGSFHAHFYPRLGRLIHSVAPDIVHIDEEPYNVATWHALWLARRQNARALWFSWQNLNRVYPWPFRAIERYSLTKADYAIVGSAGAAAVWREKGYSGPMSVIPQFGVAPDTFYPRQMFPVTGRSFVFGYVGRLVPEKGVDVLLRAIAGLAGSWRLVIAGTGPEQQSLEMLVGHLGLQDRVSFEGFIPSVRMPAFYRELDALVVPSQSRSNWVEQFGRVLVEAMASGVPVIGSNSGEIPHVIGDCGLVFAETDKQGLRDCLARVIQDSELRAHLIQCGRERVLSLYTQARIAQQTVDVYRQMMHIPRS